VHAAVSVMRMKFTSALIPSMRRACSTLRRSASSEPQPYVR
jgi:hypothetical protein